MWDWSELPPGIIFMISLCIDNPFDLIHFRSVCSCWRSFSLSTFRPIPSFRCPLPLDVAVYGGDCHILRSRVYLITKSLPRAPPRFWFFKLQEEENGALTLQCFFERRTPSSQWLCSYPCLSIDLLNSQVIEIAQEHVACYTSWCELLDNGSPYKVEECIGFMRLGAEFMVLGNLSFQGIGIYRSYEDRWTEIETNTTYGPYLEGITPFNGQIYAINSYGVTRVVKPTLELISFQRSRPCDKTRKRWLINSKEKLLLVEMCTETQNEFHKAQLLAEKGWFEISELNEERNDWIQMEDPGGRVLFLDDNCPFSFFTNQIPGFKPNSIIFRDIFGLVGHQVFEFGEQGFRTFEDIPEYIQFYPSFPCIISNG